MPEPRFPSATGQFEARHDDVGRATAFAEAFCATCGIDRRHALRLALVVEELFTNTIRHGHGGDSVSPVRLVLTHPPAAIDIVYEDSAAAYDPLPNAGRPRPDLAVPLDARVVGGLGIELVVRLVVDASYRREGERNQLRLRLALGAERPDGGGPGAKLAGG